jgi:hypothetical protein
MNLPDLTSMNFSATDVVALLCFAFVAGILVGRYRTRVGRWVHWRVFHAGVHMPRTKRR